jgi:hypothetical protein
VILPWVPVLTTKRPYRPSLVYGRTSLTRQLQGGIYAQVPQVLAVVRSSGNHVRPGHRWPIRTDLVGPVSRYQAVVVTQVRGSIGPATEWPEMVSDDQLRQEVSQFELVDWPGEDWPDMTNHQQAQSEMVQ